MVTPGPTISVSDYHSPHPFPHPKIKPTMSITQIENLEEINCTTIFLPLFLGKRVRGKIVLSVGCWPPNFLPFLFLE